MKRLVLLALLAGCAPLEIYYRPGVPVAKLAADTNDCEVRARAKAPVVLRTHREPPEYVGPRRHCDSAGNCVIEPGYWEPGHVYTIDVNRDLRRRVEAQCMARRGYTPVSIPQCPSGLKATGQTRTLPRLTEKSCVIRDKAGGFVIVEQG